MCEMNEKIEIHDCVVCYTMHITLLVDDRRFNLNLMMFNTAVNFK